jgi:hypothetical protein
LLRERERQFERLQRLFRLADALGGLRGGHQGLTLMSRIAALPIEPRRFFPGAERLREASMMERGFTLRHECGRILNARLGGQPVAGEAEGEEEDTDSEVMCDA